MDSKKAKVRLGIQTVDGKKVEVRDSCFHEIEDFVADNLGESALLSTAALAERFNYSTSQFARRFKAVSGKSVKEYVTDARMQKAQELLRTVNLSITEIAFQLGYANPFYFTNVFTKHHGLSPTAYRSKFSKLRR